MSFLGRVMTSLGAAARTFRTTYANPQSASIPLEEFGWDVYEARLARYWLYTMFYTNKVYSNLNRHAAQYRADNKLYRHIRGVYNPVQRLIGQYVSKVWGGGLDLERLDTGAIPIRDGDDSLRDAIRQLWIWSNWQRKKSLCVRWGSNLGDVALKVIDDRVREQVRLEVLDPRKIKQVDFDSTGRINSLVIEYEREDEEGRQEVGGRTYTYREEIDLTSFRTFKNGDPFAYAEDAFGNPVPEWPNEYGFVPVVLGQFADEGQLYGGNAYYSILDKVNELNDIATLTNDQLRKVVGPVWYYAGVQRARELEIQASDAEKDEIPAIYGPAGSQPYPMVHPLPLNEALALIGAIQKEIEYDLPVLKLFKISEQGPQTAPGVMAQYSDAIDQVQEARGMFDGVLVQAQRMAIAIGGYNGYENFQGYTLDLDAPNTVHYIGDRPVIGDVMAVTDRVKFLIQSKAPSSGVWGELQIPEDTISDWEDEIERQRDEFNQGVDANLETLRQGANGNSPNGNGATP